MNALLRQIRVLLSTLVFAWTTHGSGQTNSLFADPNLEIAVRDALHKTTGELTLADLAGLTSMQAPNYRIRTLSGLEAATNLRTLDVSQNDITDITAVTHLPQLVYLDLSYNSPRDLSPVLGLTNLVSLFLGSLGLDHAPLLDNMPALTQLSLASNQIQDPAPLQKLTHLQYLNLSGNPITSLAGLCGLTNLENLDVGQVSITNAQVLACFDHLLGLQLYDNQITDVAPLLSLTNLQSLDLSRNPVHDWAPLAAITNLVALSVQGAALSNLNWVLNLGNLSYLGLSQNALADLFPLTGLTNLTSLDLSENLVTNYEALAALPHLGWLNLDGNSITELSSLAHSYSLVSLSLVRNRISNLGPLSAMTNLVSLELGLNLLTNISVLRTLPRLQSVTLHDNLLDLTPGSEAITIIESLQTNGVSVYYQPQLERPQILVRPQWLLLSGQKSWLSGLLVDDASSALQPPSLGAHSSNQVILPDSSFVLTHSSDYYTWALAVTPAPGQTGVVTLSIAATNYGGLWTNFCAQIKVLQSMPFKSEALDAPELVWSTAGDPGWWDETFVTHDGVAAAQSGTPDSVIQTTVAGPGTLRFWWKLHSDYYYAHSQFSAVDLDSNQHGSEELARGDEVWQHDAVGLPVGNWLLKWSPSLDFWCCGGDLNTLWLDQVSFEPGQPRFWLDPQSYDYQGGGRWLYFHGVLGQSYQIEVSEDLRHWSLLTQVTCENFVMSVVDRKIGARARFYRARQLSGP